MNKVWTIAKREVYCYLFTPTAYALMAAFLTVSGYFFAISVISSRYASVQSMLGNSGLIMVFVAPLLTMRLLADEANQGTEEMLFTNPVTTGQVVAGKFLGAAIILTVLILIMLIYPFVLDYYGNPDWGVTIAGYIGFWLMSNAFLAAGIFTSSLTDSQLVAGVSGVALLLLLWVIDWAGGALGPPMEDIFYHLSVTERFIDFNRGIIDTGNVSFYVCLIIGFLFLSVRVVDSRQWRQ